MSELALQLIAENKAKHARGEDARVLDLGNCGLTEVPEEVGDLVWLETLNLSNRWEEYGQNQILYVIDSKNNGENNNIRSLSNSITKLVKLKKLVMVGRYIKRWDLHDLSPLDQLRNLSHIFLSYTSVKDLSPLSNLLNLKQLDCSSTFVDNLEPIKNLIILEQFTCSNTQIKDLSPLIKLINSGNQVVFEQATPNSKIIVVENCPLTNPPVAIAQQGNAAILEYFRQKEKTGEAPLLEAKLILLGDGRSGKTSLANRLLGKPLPSEADRTQGVDIVIGEYNFEVAQQHQFKLNIWDFAGQDKYKPLHQFFYTESSLYVMVADSGNASTDFDDWLQTAELFGEGSPLVLVLNEFRDGIGFGTFDREIWQKRFPNLLKEVFVVNLDTQRGFDVLEHQLRLLAQSLPHTRYPYPNNWAAIRRELESRRDENFISFQEYLRICRNNQLPEKESALVLAQVLHKIGVCLHYQKSDLLKQVVILKNEWATEAVYKILDDTKVAEENKGFFDRVDLERIWSEDEYADMRPQLLELMQQFKMAYPLPGPQGFVTPPLLPPAPPPDWTWPAGDDLELYIEYEFLPKALMTQFIVSRHPDIDQGKTLVWRNGVVLHWPGDALAEVQKTKLQGKDAFYIRSQGRDRKGMMTVILKTFRELHEEYKGIKSEEKVPCPCTGCTNGDNKQHYFEYRKLKNWLEKGKEVSDCDESLEKLNLLQLLENHFVFEKMEAGQPLIFKKIVERPFLDQGTGNNSSTILPKPHNTTQPKKIFISYSKKDEDFLNTLKIQLTSLRRQGLIMTWDQTNLNPAEIWDAAIRSELNAADIIIFLVSAELMATDYFWEIEMKSALEREGAIVIPLIIRPCEWQNAPFAHLNPLPERGKPISTWDNPDEAWLEVVQKIRSVL